VSLKANKRLYLINFGMHCSTKKRIREGKFAWSSLLFEFLGGQAKISDQNYSSLNSYLLAGFFAPNVAIFMQFNLFIRLQ
jgi:hypothetical protein